jgi:glycine cleavage system transcriptional repressor
MMKKIVVFVLGPDRPGIIASVAKTLFEQGCNLEDVSQTILQTEFMGIFIASMKDMGKAEEILSALQAEIAPMELFVHLRPLPEDLPQQPAGEPFIITTVGPDRPGLVAGITGVLAQYGVNITNLKAVSRGEGDRRSYIMIYEIDIPPATDHHLIRTALYDRARSLGLDINLQHREIFEQIHRV